MTVTETRRRLSTVKLSLSSLALVAACSSGNTPSDQPAAPVCGNGIVETGEGCDGQVAITCAMATVGASPVGNVTCNGCRIDATGCRSAGTGGSPGVAGNTMTLPPGTGGGPSGSGGFVGSGGVVGSGGFVSSGGVFGSGGFVSSGGSLTSGGFTANGGTAGRSGQAGSSGMAGGAGLGGGSSALGDLNALRQVCLDTINMYRAMVMAKPLTRASASVEACSDMGAQSDATTMQAHGSAGKCPGMGAQNTCPGWNPRQYGGVQGALTACLKSMWGEGEPPVGRQQCIQAYLNRTDTSCFLKYGHYLNMSDPQNGVVSCGFYLMPNGSVWMNQDLGR